MVDKSVDFSDTGDARFGEDSNGNAFIEHKTSGKRVFVDGDGFHTDEAFTKATTVEHPNDNRDFTLELRKNKRSLSQSTRDCLDLYIDSSWDEDVSEMYLVMPNGMELARHITPDQAKNIPNLQVDEYYSEVLKFLESGELGIECDVPDEHLSLQVEQGGNFRIQTNDSDPKRKHKVTRLSISSDQDYVGAEWQRTLYVRNNGTFDAGGDGTGEAEYQWGLNKAASDKGLTQRFKRSNVDGASVMEWRPQNGDNFYRFYNSSGEIVLELTENSVETKKKIDFNNQIPKGVPTGTPNDTSTVQDYLWFQDNNGNNHYVPTYQ